MLNTKSSLSTLQGGLLTLAILVCYHALIAAEIESGGGGGKVIDPELAIKQFKYPARFKVDLFAAEPQLSNPVAFCFDELGRVYVAETFRYKTSVYDIREHMN